MAEHRGGAGAGAAGRRVLLVLSFPHNPTAATVELETMTRIVDLARERDLLVVHDFAYADIGFDGTRRRRSCRSRAPPTCASSCTR